MATGNEENDPQIVRMGEILFHNINTHVLRITALALRLDASQRYILEIFVG